MLTMAHARWFTKKIGLSVCSEGRQRSTRGRGSVKGTDLLQAVASLCHSEWLLVLYAAGEVCSRRKKRLATWEKRSYSQDDCQSMRARGLAHQ